MARRPLFALLALVVTLTGCGGDADEATPADGGLSSDGATTTTVAVEQVPDGALDEGPDPSGVADVPADWVPLESAEGRFRVELPTEATFDPQTLEAAGETLELSLFVAQIDAANVYNIGFVDYPESILDLDPQLVLDGVVQGAAGNLSGTVVSQEPVEVAGHPGVDYVIEVPGGILQSRAILVERRLYLLQRAGAEPDDDGFTRMVDSFDLLDA